MKVVVLNLMVFQPAEMGEEGQEEEGSPLRLWTCQRLIRFKKTDVTTMRNFFCRQVALWYLYERRHQISNEE